MSSLSHPSLSVEESGAEELYFAYGSNMYLPQMAIRCPDSTLFARGILRRYKWQTNSLGGGNVVEANEEDFVEGIIFTVSPSDIQALRRYERVDSQRFVECRVDVEVEPILDTAFTGQKPADVAQTLTLRNSHSNVQLAQVKPTADDAVRELNRTQCHGAAEETGTALNPGGGKILRKALIYISYRYQSPGDIKEEYIVRMHLAIAYARLLGVSKTYFETSLYPKLLERRNGAQPDEGESTLKTPSLVQQSISVKQ
ncbi:MAG: hypothetical protein M1821_000697 [Bathelium mastoideum]|nr:MAG: hypothetical protein M1821_000697 [Bathelium mastoideum]